MSFVDLYKGAMAVAVKIICVMTVLLLLFPFLQPQIAWLFSFLMVVAYTKTMEYIS